MDKAQKKYIIDVIPITRLPLSGQQYFSYESSREIPAGSLVSIPLFHRQVQGIVINSRSDFHRLGNIKLKKINSVTEEIFLTFEQLKLACFISNYYTCPLGVVLKFFIPKQIKQKHKTQNTNIPKQNTKKIKLTTEQENAINEIIKNNLKLNPPAGGKNLKFLLYGPSSSGKTEVYINSVSNLKVKSPKAQFLILLPELTLTPQAIERYGEHFKPEEAAIIHSKISKGELYKNFQKIKSGEAKIIIGTRMAVFAPFRNLKLIVIDEAQDISFKQWDMNPRYDARVSAEYLSKIHNCPLVLGSATPRIEDFYQAETKKYRLLKLPKLNLSEVRPQNSERRIGGRTSKPSLPDTKIELIDMRKERWQNNYSPISKKLRSEIAYALKNNLQTILFINRQGMSAFSVCAGCKTVLRCPRCDRALIYDNQGIYLCSHCSYKTSITPQCSKCKGITFSNIGLGTQKVEKEISSLFPDARVARADSQSMRGKNAAENLYQQFKNHEIDILVGTQMISKGWDLPSLTLIGIIDGDNLLSLPDFYTAERAFQAIVQVAGRVNRPGAKFPGQVLIQTFSPEQNFWKYIVEKNYADFYAKEIADRKNLKLPPFYKLIKLIFQDYSQKKTIGQTQAVYEKLKEAAGKNATIFEPHDSFVPKIRGRFRRQIILKIPSNKKLPELIKNILSNLSSGWIIDVDPISII